MADNRCFKKLRKWCRRRHPETGYRRLPGSSEGPTTSKIRRWMRSGRIRAEEEPPTPTPTPKGQVAVYVGEGDGETCRVVVPVVYLNHPLFRELLREAEQVYGFTHSGGIKIPCPKSKLDRIQTKIATAGIVKDSSPFFQPGNFHFEI